MTTERELDRCAVGEPGVTGRRATRRLVLMVFLLALAVRLIYFAQIQDSPFFESPVIDAFTFHERAVELAQGVWHEEEVFWQPPLYPYFLGALYSVFGSKVAIARLVQLLLGAVICALVALLAVRLHGRLAGWVAGAMMALCGTMVFFEGELLNPVLSIFLNIGALLLLIPRSDTEGPRPGDLRAVLQLPTGRWLGAGALLGTSAVCRPDILVFAGIVALVPLLVPLGSKRVPAAADWLRFVAFAAAVSLPVLPVLAHNVVFGGEWVPISSNAGLNFYLGNSGDYERTVGVRPGLHWDELMLEPIRAGVAEDSAAGASAWWARRGLRSIREAPGRWLSDLGRKAALGVAAAESGRNLELKFFSRYAPLLGWLPGWGVIFPLGVIGAFLAWRARRNGVLLVLLFSYAFVLLVFFASARYRLPMIPVLAILAGLAADRAWSWWKSGSRTTLVAWGTVALVLGLLIRLVPAPSGPAAEADGQYFVAKALANQGRDAAAVRSLERVLAIAPEHWDAAFDLAAARTNLGQLPRAIPLYRRILDHYPGDRESLLALTDGLVRLGSKLEAVEILRSSAANPRATADLVYAIGRKLLSLGYVEEAVSVGRQAQRRGVTDHHLDELLAKMTRVHAGRRRLAACLGESSSLEWATHQDRTRSDLAAAEALLHRGEHLDAELAVVEAITAGAAATDCNEDPAAWNLVGKLWFLQRSKLAPDALRLAIRMDPDLAEAHLGLAHALAADPGALDEAEVALESFLRLSPHGADAERARRALAGLAERRARREESPPPE